jgi:hypothetical protein
LSSAILYLAIVAIWACVLVPRWLRRSHVAPSDPEVLSDQNEGDQAEYDPYDEFAPAGPGAATVFEEDAAAYADPLAWEDPAAPAAPEGSAAGSYSVTASYSSYSAEVTYEAETADSSEHFDTADSEGYAEAGDSGRRVETGGFGGYADTTDSGEYIEADDSGWHAETGDSDRYAGHPDPGPPAGPGAPVAHRNPAADPRHPQVPMRPPGPSPHVMQARRRTLTMIIAVTVAAMGAALIGLVPWWTSVAPFLILGMYLLLLREAAHADTERAHSWAEAQARAAAARAAHEAHLARERAREAQLAPPPQPTAEIINISALTAKTGDQLYDQYADAEIRAVGD